jgi:UDP-glucose 4-epimerase
MARVLVTGGGGFIGSHLAERLLTLGHDVVILDNFSTGRRENIKPFRDRITLYEADIRDREALLRAMEGVDCVFHEAALPSVPRSVQNPLESHDVNATGTLTVLLAARDSGVRRVIYAASSSAYGDTESPVKNEHFSPRPISPYGASKLAGEYYCQVFNTVYSLEAVCLRYFNVFGPRQNPDSPYTGVMAIFIPAMLRGERPRIFGDGSATRDYTYIDNNVDANILAMTAQGVSGEVINTACGGRVSVLEVVEILNRILGTSIQPEFCDPRPGDILHSCADTSKARRLLKLEPRISVEEGLRRTVEWYRQELAIGRLSLGGRASWRATSGSDKSARREPRPPLK